MNIQLVVFDLAGTTVKDEDGVNTCFRGALSAVGVEAERDTVNAMMGLPKPLAIRKLLEAANRGDLFGQIEQIHNDFSERMIQFYRTDPSVVEIEGTSDVFRQLKKAGIKIAVNTGFHQKITSVLLDRLGWEHEGLIDTHISSDEVEQGRPAPDMIREIMKRLNIVDSQTVAKIGDTPADLEEGTNANCGLIIGVTEGTHSREQLSPYPHTHLVENVRAIPGLLKL